MSPEVKKNYRAMLADALDGVRREPAQEPHEYNTRQAVSSAALMVCEKAAENDPDAMEIYRELTGRN